MSKLSDGLTIVRRSLRAAKLEAYRTRRELAAGSVPAGDDATALDGRQAEVLLYFADGPDNLYQVRQWLPVLEQLDRQHPTAILCREGRTHEMLTAETRLPVVLVRAFRDLEPFYEAVGAKVCLYVNAHPRNFQSLAFAGQLHVHLNHGESDKISMASNQAKAYDRVIVAGDAAVERYRRNLLDYDGRNLVKVGRPQLDLLPPHRPSPDGRTTVVYAPTWEGGRAAMDYSSVRSMGPDIVAALSGAGHRVVYRPHPRTGAHDPEVAAAHARTVQVTRSEGGSVSSEEPLLEVLSWADVLIADVSSVTLEFLPTGRPFFVTQPDGRAGMLLPGASSTDRLGYPLYPDDLGDLGRRVDRLLTEDPLVDERSRMVERYFGDTSPGASMRRFLEAVGGMVAERDRLVQEKRATR